MPRPINHIQITGVLTMDPKIMMIEKGGKPLKIANFPIVFDWWMGKKLDKPWYFNCTSFASSADAVEKFLEKGKKILITDAYLQPNQYKGKDGLLKKEIKIIVQDFLLLGLNKQIEGKDFDAIAQEIEDGFDTEIPI